MHRKPSLHCCKHAHYRYLTYENAVEAWLAGVDRVWQQHTGRRLAELHKHLLAAGEAKEGISA